MLLIWVIGTGISLWTDLAQSQVDSQIQADRRSISVFIQVMLLICAGAGPEALSGDRLSI